MVRSMASLGLEVGWRWHRAWKDEMEKLQYAVLKKCTGAVVAASREYVRKVVAVESVEMFARVTAGGFLPWTMCDASPSGVARGEAIGLEGAGALSL